MHVQKSSMELLFCVRQLVEKYRENKKYMHGVYEFIKGV